MLQTADSLTASDYPDTFEVPTSARRATPRLNSVTDLQPSDGGHAGRYGEGRKRNVPAIALTVFLHVVALAAVLHIRHEAVPEERKRLMVVDLKAAASEPPPAAAKPVPPATPAIVAPTPRIQVSPVAPTIATAPEPAPALPVPAAASAPPGPPAPPAQPGTMQSSDLGTRMISGEPPRYPTECRRKHEEGTVVLALTLGVDGRVQAISVARSSGHSRLDDAALRAVRKWRWAPTMQEGRPMMVRGQVEIPFVLQG